jgi:hypothetical protein
MHTALIRHQLCTLWALISPTPPPCCPSFPSLSLFLTHTRLLSHIQFSAHLTLTSPAFSYTSNMLLSLIGSLLVWESHWELAIHSVLWASEQEPIWCCAFPSCFIFNPTCQQANLFACYCFMLVFCLAYSTLKMEATCSSNMSVEFQQTKQHYIPDNGTLLFSSLTYLLERNKKYSTHGWIWHLVWKTKQAGPISFCSLCNKVL